MKQIFKKLVKQKTKIIGDNGKVYYIKETSEEEINKINNKIQTIRRATRNRKNKNKIYDDLSLRITESRSSINHHKTDIIVIKDRIIEFENLRKNRKLIRSIKLTKYIRVRSDVCEIDIHRASYARHLKN